MKCTVEVREVWSRTFEVEIPDDAPALTGCQADRKGLADYCRAKANEMSQAGDDDKGFEYSDTMEPDKWTVRTADGDYLP